MNLSEPRHERAMVISPGSLLSKFPITVEFSEEYKTDISHWHDYVQIWYVAEGSLHHTIKDKLYIQKPGSIIFVPPYTTHNIDTRPSKTVPRFALIAFTDDLLTDNGCNFFSYISEYAQFEGRRLPVFREFSGDEKIAADNITYELHREFSKAKHMSSKKLSALLAELLSLLTDGSDAVDMRGMRRITERANAVTSAVRYMSNHYSEKITLDTLCDVAHMSRSFLTESFRSVIGKTAFEVLISIRLAKAVLSLLYSDLTLSEIARNVGFVTKNRLANEFSKRIGMPPMEYRRRMQTESIERDEKIAERWEWLNHPDE